MEEIKHKMRTAIFSQPFGGLGDNLQFTTLPALFYTKGIEFYLSTRNKFRNKEIYNIVWEKNPYVKGFMNAAPNVGHPAYSAGSFDIKERNLVSCWEIAHGFKSPDESGAFKPPSVFYIPDIIHELRDNILIDLGCIHYGPKYLIDNIITHVKDKFDNDKLIHLHRKDQPELHNAFGDKRITDKVIEYNTYIDYMNIICSCKGVICLNSGTHALCSALKVMYPMDIYCYIHNNFFPDGISAFLFDNVEYITLPSE